MADEQPPQLDYATLTTLTPEARDPGRFDRRMAWWTAIGVALWLLHLVAWRVLRW